MDSCSWYLFVTLALSTMVQSIYAGLDRSCSSSSYVSARKWVEVNTCGSVLGRVLMESCPYGVYMGEQAKRSGLVKRTSKHSKMYHRKSQSPFIEKSHAIQFLQEKRFSKAQAFGGIVCECCINPCSPNEMSQYCNTAPRRRRSTESERSEVFTDEMVDEIYAKIHEMTASIPDIPIQEALQLLEDFENDPYILMLEQNKIRNSEASERLFSDENNVDKSVETKRQLKDKVQMMIASDSITAADLEKLRNLANLVREQMKRDSDDDSQ